jgi:glycosyltransferase involved in cell wall biosynthesis
MKILFFLESLYRGGKERRALELIQYLKQECNIEVVLVLTEEEIYYQSVKSLGIPIEIIKRRGIKYDPGLFIKFYRCCKRHKPDIIHAWGKMTAFYSVPASLTRRIPLVSSMISDSKRNFSKFSIDAFFFKIGTLFSDVILSNSISGLLAYDMKTSKAEVILNGVNIERFQQEHDSQKLRCDLGIATKYMLVMVASFTRYKDYDLFVDTAKEMQKVRSDITFVGVGDGYELNRIQQRIRNEKIENVILTGMRTDVEAIINASDIGLLCTYSEGISNSIIEYMALGKPVISTDVIGGSRELILEGVTGYSVERRPELVIEKIMLLLDNLNLRLVMGERGKERIRSRFSVERMGKEFVNLYGKVLAKNMKVSEGKLN